jgi:aspartyl/asparaginyl beta-hydroxylase (cupin superfamily)
MSLRVLADESAKTHVLHLRHVLDSGFVDTINQVTVDCTELARPEIWDGPLARQFEAQWPDLQRSLHTVHEQLTQLAGSIDAITTQILAAGGI